MIASGEGYLQCKKETGMAPAYSSDGSALVLFDLEGRKTDRRQLQPSLVVSTIKELKARSALAFCAAWPRLPPA